MPRDQLGPPTMVSCLGTLFLINPSISVVAFDYTFHHSFGRSFYVICLTGPSSS